MTPPAPVVADSEAALRDWLRARYESCLPARIAVGVVAGDEPAVSIHRIGGTDDPGDAPLDLPGVQIDVWGTAGTQASRSQCRAAANELRAHMDMLNAGRVRLDATTVCDGAGLVSDLWLPEGDRPRYVLSYLLTTRYIPQ
jgi:hypothetical protein